MDLNLDSFKLSIPRGFSTRMVVFAGPVEILEGTGLELRQSVVITCEDVETGTSADDFAELQLDQLATTNPGFTIERRSSVKIAKVTCPLFEARSSIPGGPDLVNMLAYVVRGGEAYALSASDVAGPRYEAARPRFLTMFESFEPLR